MALIDSESIILKTYPLAEADKIVILLTPKYGLIRGVAKGAKRLKSRFGGSLEPFSIVNLHYYQKEERELVSINGIEIIKSFFSEAVKPEFLQKFAYLSELLIEFAPPSEPNERLYRMVCVCFETAKNEPDFLESVVLYFELWLLRLGGFLPNWNQCFNCQRELSFNESPGLQINFQLLCKNCQKSKSNLLVSPSEREIFLKAQNLSPSKFIELTRDRLIEVREVSSVLKRIIAHILGKESVGERVLFTTPKENFCE